ncbi:MAG TPA: choice-of-anchor Q domain-containing protein [Solirubrobacterales bacterium]|nr:choice-of-anchor Q domain-containing protein [Solirubrobacterales bacterium]
MRATLAALALAIVPIVPTTAAAQTITVDSTADVSGSGCILRDAILSADSDSVHGGCAAGEGADTIRFSLPPESTIVVGSKLPTINSTVGVEGPGTDELTISGDEAVGAFGIGSSGVVSISGLTVAETLCVSGCAITNQGGLVLTNVLLTDNGAVLAGGTNAFPSAGAIFNNGSLEVVESELTGNFAAATGATGQSGPSGGAIANLYNGEVTIVDSTLAGNQVVAESDPAGTTNANGGAIANFGKLTIRSSTLSGNSASGTGSSVGNVATGGAISNANALSVVVTIERSTITGNSVVAASPVSSTGGGGIVTSGGTFLLSSSTVAGNSAALGGANLRLILTAIVRSTIVADPLGGSQSCAGGLTSQGFNLDEGSGCGFDQASDLSGVDPLLAPVLADNGGPTRTLALEVGSPAIDRGLAGAGETVDQREFQRPVDIASVLNAPGSDGADIGAFEVQVPNAAVTAGPAQGSTISEAEPTFEFDADDAAATFECSLDGAAPVACTSPDKLPPLADGPHTFSVVAIDPAGYAGPAAVRSFTVNTAQLPVSGSGSGGGAGSGGGRPQTAAPETALSPLPARTRKRRLKIRFSSSLPGSTFSCKLDRRRWRNCRSPLETPKLAFGRHTIQVRATHAGVTDPTPAKRTFRVLRPLASR